MIVYHFCSTLRAAGGMSTRWVTFSACARWRKVRNRHILIIFKTEIRFGFLGGFLSYVSYGGCTQNYTLVSLFITPLPKHTKNVFYGIIFRDLRSKWNIYTRTSFTQNHSHYIYIKFRNSPFTVFDILQLCSWQEGRVFWIKTHVFIGGCQQQRPCSEMKSQSTGQQIASAGSLWIRSSDRCLQSQETAPFCSEFRVWFVSANMSCTVV